MAKGGSLATKSVLVQGNIMFGGMDMFEQIECIKKLKEWMDSKADQYGLMFHDMDTEDNGEPKTPHVHFVAHLYANGKGSPRLGTTLNSIADFCGVGTLAVSIFKPDSMEIALQYFTHQNKPLKAQYPKERMITNIEPLILDSMLTADVQKLDYERLMLVVAHASYKSDILREIGLYYYRMYRPIINDLWEEFHSVRVSRARTNSILECVKNDN